LPAGQQQVSAPSHRRQSGGKLSAGTIVLAAAMLLGHASPAWAQSAGTQQADAVTGPVTFAPPPRSIADITAILDQQKPDPTVVAQNKAKADAEPPSGLSGAQLARFYSDRGSAAGDLGRETQRLADYRKAYDILAADKDKYLGFYAAMVNLLAAAETRAGHRREALRLRLDIANITGSSASMSALASSTRPGRRWPSSTRCAASPPTGAISRLDSPSNGVRSMTGPMVSISTPPAIGARPRDS